MNNSKLFNHKNILLVAGMGGHGEQMKRLREKLEGASITLVAEKGFNWKYPDTVYYSDRVVDYHKKSAVKSAINFVKALFIAGKAIRKSKAKVIISTGPALAVPVCLTARLFGLKVVHIESWSRIKSISNTTKLLLKYKIANVVAYQYKNSVLKNSERCQYWGHM